MKQVLVISSLALMLMGCKADLVEIRINSSDIVDAIAGEAATARFIANFSTFGELDEEQRRQISSLEEIVGTNIIVDDFQVTRGDYKTSITVEGELPIVLGKPGSSAHAFSIYVTPSNDPHLSSFAYSVQMGSGSAFKRMESDMQGVSYMLAIDEVQPLQYRLRADSGGPLKVLAGGVQIDGENFGVHTLNLAHGDRISLTFSGGAYDTVAGGFLISEP